MTRTIATLSLLVVLSGCTASYQVEPLSGSQRPTLDPAAPLYVAVPEDGAYGETVYQGSGQLVTQAVASAFSARAGTVAVADQHVDRQTAMEQAAATGARYLVWPTIVHWEARATEWSGRPSRMALRVTIIDVESSRQVDSTAIEGRSRRMTFTSTSPEALLKEPLQQYVDGLY